MIEIGERGVTWILLLKLPDNLGVEFEAEE
jgi:hypothetical protein